MDEKTLFIIIITYLGIMSLILFLRSVYKELHADHETGC